LASFQGPGLAALLGPALTFKALPLDAPPGSVLMQAAKAGRPLLCEKSFGKGKVLLFASSCNRAWSDFPIRPAFLLWARFVADYLTQEPLSLLASHFTGDAVRIPARPGEDGPLEVRKPDGKRVLAERGPGGDYVFTDTVEPGVYAVDTRGRNLKFAVNLEGRESDLTYLQADGNEAAVKELKERLGGAENVAYLDSPDRLDEVLGGARRGWPLWTIFLVLVLLIGLFEPWLANQISARLFGKAPALPLASPEGRAAAASLPALARTEGAVR
jgi:hypothetical protein